MTDFYLKSHPDFPPGAVRHVNASVERTPRGLTLNYVVEASTADLALPLAAKPYRTDELWRTTCLELFAADFGTQYLEFNFSPSSQWAAYKFDSYRKGMVPFELNVPPRIFDGDEGWALIMPVHLDLPDFTFAKIGLSAVIEETDGTKSYWALAHAPGPPDFHNPDCFIATLPAPAAP